MYQKSIVSLEITRYWRRESGEGLAKSLFVLMELLGSVDADVFVLTSEYSLGPVVARCMSWILFEIQHIYANELGLTHRFTESKEMEFAHATSTSRQSFGFSSSNNAEIEPRSCSWLPEELAVEDSCPTEHWTLLIANINSKGAAVARIFGILHSMSVMPDAANIQLAYTSLFVLMMRTSSRLFLADSSCF